VSCHVVLCRAVQVLSANSESPLNCECLMEDHDFHSQLTRYVVVLCFCEALGGGRFLPLVTALHPSLKVVTSLAYWHMQGVLPTLQINSSGHGLSCCEAL
jgi:hypothetical protein